jgi:hypothetical protein
MNEEIDYWYSEYELRRFIDTAKRWDIDVWHKFKNDKQPYGQFTYEVIHARVDFEKFATQLNRKLTNAGSWKAIELDLNSRFIVMINQYIDWYNENKPRLEKFQPYCPYTIMLSVIESTKNEIQKYFPNIGSEKGDQTDKTLSRKIGQNLSFECLFKHPYNTDRKINELKDILKTHEYIDENHQWTGITEDKNELATLYWLFKEKPNILNPGKVTPQLKTFYKEFGLIVYTDKEPAGYCTLKNISKHPGNTPTYRNFELIFKNWIDKE